MIKRLPVAYFLSVYQHLPLSALHTNRLLVLLLFIFKMAARNISKEEIEKLLEILEKEVSGLLRLHLKA